MSEFPTYHFENKPKVLGGIALILFGVVGFDGFGLDDNCCITFGHGSAFGGDGACYITRGSPNAMAMAVAMDTTRIGASISVNSRIHFVGLEECTGRIGNPNKICSHWWTKQKI